MGNISSNPEPIRKNHMFSLTRIKHHYSLIPIISVFVYKGALLSGFVWWMAITRDVTYVRSLKPVNERMDLLNPYFLKLLVINEQLCPAEELDEAYKAMAQKEKEANKLKEECNKLKPPKDED